MPAERGPLEIAWVTADLDRARAVLTGLGLEGREDGGFSAGAVILAVRLDPANMADRLVIEGEAEAGDAGPVDGPRVVALGWATVDAERFADDLGRSLSAEVLDDPDLGAYARLLGRDEAVADGAPALRLITLEPSTEGRLAGALARHDEGLIALYLDGVTVPPDALPPHPTPLGRSGRLVPPTQVSGPYIVILGSS